MSDEQFTQIARWFETLSAKVDRNTTRLDALTEDVHEIRELLKHLQDDDRVQREAIANIARRLDIAEQRP